MALSQNCIWLGITADDLMITADDIDLDTLGDDISFETLEKVSGAVGAEKLFQHMTPNLRLAVRSPFLMSRRLVQMLVETGVFYDKNALKIATPHSVENAIIAHDRALGEVLTDLRTHFLKHRGITSEGGNIDLFKTVASDSLSRGKRPEGQLSWNEFRSEVGKAMRRQGFQNEADIHPNADVRAAANAFRDKLFRPAAERLQGHGFLKGLEGPAAASYLTRIFNIQLLRTADGRAGFKALLENWLGKELRKADIDKIKASDLKQTGRPRAGVDDLTPSQKNLTDADSISEGIIDNLLNDQPGGLINWENIPDSIAGPMKGRVINISDIDLEPYLISDIEQISRFYHRSVAPDLELLDQFGSLDLADEIKALKKEGKARIDKARKQGKTKLADDLTQLLKSDEDDINALVKLLRGRYKAPSNPDALVPRLGRNFRRANLITQGGLFAVSSIPDIGAVVFVNGLSRTVGAGLIPMLTNFKSFKLAAAEAKRWGIAWDNILNTRARALEEVGDDGSRITSYERGLDNVSRNFSIANLLSPWNTAIKQFSSVVTAHRIMESVEAVADGTIKRGDMRRLARSGINEQMARKMAQQTRKHGIRDGGLLSPQSNLWDDPELSKLFGGALRRDVNQQIVTPSVGERSLWMNTEVGKVLAQYKAFAMSATTRILMSGLQARDLSTLNGAAIMSSLGMMVYAHRQWVNGRPLSDDPVVWMTEGVSRSGLTASLSEINSVIEGLTGVGLSTVTGGPQTGRYRLKGTLGVLNPMSRLIGSLASGQATHADTRAAFKLLPYHKIVWTGDLFRRAEDGINSTLGLPARRTRE